jgi:HD-like signal output (HDOD) protein
MSTAWRPAWQFQTTIDHMEKILAHEADQRDSRPGLTWIEAERSAMHTAVNSLRSRWGLPEVNIAAIERVENMARGHVDYIHKFALYCAELALGQNEPQP